MEGIETLQELKDAAEEVRLNRIYSTISACSTIIIFAWLFYLIAALSAAVSVDANSAPDRFPHGVGPMVFSHGMAAVVVAAIWIVVIALSSWLFGTRRFSLFYIEHSWSNTVRGTWLPVVTVLIIMTLGLMVVYSGGSLNSGFSHFLIATSSIALLLAESIGVRVLVVLITFATYVVGLVVSAAPIIPFTDTLFWRSFNGVSVACTLVLAVAAAIRSKTDEVKTAVDWRTAAVAIHTRLDRIDLQVGELTRLLTTKPPV